MIRIDASVGRNGQNRFQDVATVQTLLNDCRHLLEPLPAVSPSGVVGPETIRAIEEFQRRVMKMQAPDGRVDPGGRTLNTLVAERREGREQAPATIPLPGKLVFPLSTRPRESYKEGMRRFGANRDGGRKHAGVDLYAPVGTPVYAMDDGEVIQNLYHFYRNTYALEVRHPSFIARYGELRQDIPRELRKGAPVKRGQLIGYVGQLQGLNMSMLHLEIYSGAANGQLTVDTNLPFKRRSDLIDPTPILDTAAAP
jgi:murein DD-endopeptidase MepM/ murein hydrolase activator NlpD